MVFSIIKYMNNFKQLIKPPDNFAGDKEILVYHEMEILVQKNSEKYKLPSYNLITSHYSFDNPPAALGIMDGVFYSIHHVDEPKDIPENTELLNVRHLFGSSDENLFHLAGFGRHIADWESSFRYCGRCGTLTGNHPKERAKLCPKCGLISYPRISPAMICAVTRGDEILLARGNRFTIPVYSVLAGFVEPGESLEETVSREIMEETRISVKNIKYFGNQPWPFSSSLMLAFTAEYDGGDIIIDDDEIIDAGWYKADNLPMLPSPYSIARRLIADFEKKYEQEKS